jgi:hypothetical protein
VLQFHPDTDDNGVWATGRKLEKPVTMKRRRQPTPFIHGEGALLVSEFVPPEERYFGGLSDQSDEDDEPSPSRRARAHHTGPLSPTRNFRPRRGIVTSNINGFATSIPYPVRSIVMTDGNGLTCAWQVTPDIFEDVGVYLQVRCAGRVAEGAHLEQSSKCGATERPEEQPRV